MAETHSGTKVREAVAVFDDVSSLEAAVGDLRAAGFGQHDISLLAAHAAVERKLGHMYRRVEELEDNPQAPRTAFVSGKNMDARENRLLGSLTSRGRVAIVDYRKGQPRGPPEEHRLSPEQVRKELEAAGYRLVEDHGFLPNQYFLIFARAGG